MKVKRITCVPDLVSAYDHANLLPLALCEGLASDLATIVKTFGSEPEAVLLEHKSTGLYVGWCAVNNVDLLVSQIRSDGNGPLITRTLDTMLGNKSIVACCLVEGTIASPDELKLALSIMTPNETLVMKLPKYVIKDHKQFTKAVAALESIGVYSKDHLFENYSSYGNVLNVIDQLTGISGAVTGTPCEEQDVDDDCLREISEETCRDIFDCRITFSLRKADIE